jgi:hypothetical protein
MGGMQMPNSCCLKAKLTTKNKLLPNWFSIRFTQRGRRMVKNKKYDLALRYFRNGEIFKKVVT